jgi:hypothetical protein
MLDANCCRVKIAISNKEYTILLVISLFIYNQ